MKKKKGQHCYHVPNFKQKFKHALTILYNKMKKMAPAYLPLQFLPLSILALKLLEEKLCSRVLKIILIGKSSPVKCLPFQSVPIKRISISIFINGWVGLKPHNQKITLIFAFFKHQNMSCMQQIHRPASESFYHIEYYTIM